MFSGPELEVAAGRDYLNRRRRGKQAWRLRRRAIKRTEKQQLLPH